MIVFRSILEHIDEVRYFTVDLGFQIGESAAKAEVADVAKKESALLMPHFAFREEYSWKM